MTNEQEQNCLRSNGKVEAKWAAIIDDRLAPMPRRCLRAHDILHQSGAKPDTTLVRDFNSPNDVGFEGDSIVDLAEGNVFRTTSGCVRNHKVASDAPPKLAFVVDDRWEVTIQPHQTGETLRGLLAVLDDKALLRDFESPRDEIIKEEERVEFADGPVFITRDAEAKEITIIVKGRPQKWTSKTISFDQVVALAYNPVRTGPGILYTVSYSRGPKANPEGELLAGGTVKVRDRMVFLVTETNQS